MRFLPLLGRGSFHVGTIAAKYDRICFVYATLSAWLGSSTVLKDRAKEYVNPRIRHGHVRRTSTMSTLAVEEFTLLRTSAVAGAIVYCLTTFVAGFVIAYAGACLGSALVHCGEGRCVMDAILPIAMCLCGGLGASARYACDSYIKAIWHNAFPYRRSSLTSLQACWLV